MTADAVGGVWPYSLDLITDFVREGAEVLLVTQGPEPSADQTRQFAGIHGTRLLHLGGALEWMPDGFNDFSRACRLMLEIEHEFQPEIVHLNGYSLAAASWKAPVVTVAHSCVFSWWQAVHHSDPGNEWREYRERVRQGLAAANAIVAPSRFMRDSVVLHYGIAADSINIISNFSTAEVTNRGRKAPYVLAAGRMWDLAKNLRLLQAIAGDLAWPLRIAGSEPESTSDEGVSYLGRLSHPEVLAQMSEAGIFAHPAVYEPFGLAVLEAARSGCCLVLADIPSMHELWDGAAVFVEAGNARAWAAAINELTQERNRLTQLAEQARTRAGQFRRDELTTKYRLLYAQAIAHKATAGVAA